MKNESFFNFFLSKRARFLRFSVSLIKNISFIYYDRIMKKLLLLILVSCFCLGIKAQADSSQPFFVFSNEDESYDLIYKANFVDVYFANGLHFFLIYKLHLEHIKGGITTLGYELTYQEGVPGILEQPYKYGTLNDADGDNPMMKFQDMFWQMGDKTNKVREVSVKINRHI